MNSGPTPRRRGGPPWRRGRPASTARAASPRPGASPHSRTPQHQDAPTGGAGAAAKARPPLPYGPPWRRWLRDPRPASRLPLLSSLAVLVFQQAGSHAAASGQVGERVPLDTFARLLLTLGPLLLVLRHLYPRTAAFGTAVVASVYLGAGYPYGPVLVSVAVACFAALVAGHRYAAWSAVVLLWAGHMAAGHWLYHWLPPDGDGPQGWGSELFVAAWVVAIVAAAELVRTRRQEWARRLAEEEAEERRRADEERLRIARELHDVLAHSISVINVQAGVGLALLDSDPDQARTALTTIKAASKEVLGEVRQVLDSLRTPGDAPRAPAPGLDSLPELTAQAADAGLRVTTGTEGTPAALPPGADLAAFRIVQEALTNVVRHSAARTARVRLRYGPAELELVVDDDGPAHGSGLTTGGNGLVGMRERATALGGSVEAGPRGDGGFRVRARIPAAPPGTGPDPATPTPPEPEPAPEAAPDPGTTPEAAPDPAPETAPEPPPQPPEKESS